ncbi:hypothetical protein [Myxococcus stipitatus]|uniref:hypothetical protein n=1 Tax=Myxococcus stipitatus TaxID=83455 RepID=UPI0030CC16C2
MTTVMAMGTGMTTAPTMLMSTGRGLLTSIHIDTSTSTPIRMSTAMRMCTSTTG